MKRPSLLILMILLCAFSTLAQKKDSLKVVLNHYSLTIGLGWTHFINSLEIGKEEAITDAAGVSLKFFWEPEHRLSLGLESGFYRLYKVKNKTYTDMTGQASMSAIPLLLTIRMRIVDHFYLSAGAGLALMFNKVSVIGDQVNCTILSLSNYQFSASYLYPFGNHWRVGGEFKVLNFGKANDWMYSVQALCAFRL